MATRRTVLKLGAAAAALAVAYPVGSHLAWSAKSFEAPDGVIPDPASSPGGRVWSNWSGLQSAAPQQIASPASEDELAALIGNTHGSIRPVGTGHSFTALAPTDGVMVDIGRLSGLVSHDSQARTVTMGAGTRLEHASRLLDDIGLALPNLPDIAVQTLAGSFATATHGTGRDLPALHEAILGFRLVTPQGRILDVTADSHPDLFAAGKVSLGALGVITRYTLRVTDAFALRRRVWVDRVENMLDQAESLSREHRNFEFYCLPHTGFGAGFAHDLFDGEPEGRAPSEDEDSLASLRQLRDMFGWSPRLRRWIAGTQIRPGVMEDYTDKSWRLLSTSRVTKFNETEYHLPHENGLAAVREVLTILERHKDTFFPMEVRFVRGDDAWLSPFKSASDISIAVHAANTEDYRYLLSEIGPVFRRHGGRPHWGKLHDMNWGELSALYPRLGDFNALRRELDPEGKFLNPHLATLFGEEAHV
ncbi:D-arabinono-1,4-lactone oxidase [Maricaulis sp.]|uniref:D-arabinono-1,4-lactone oxidase n=1 Tax=Maricaulis sp. TaxID=1486257 RepID=UPI003A92F52B